MSTLVISRDYDEYLSFCQKNKFSLCTTKFLPVKEDIDQCVNALGADLVIVTGSWGSREDFKEVVNYSRQRKER